MNRALHLIDLDNLMMGPSDDPATAAMTASVYRRVAGYHTDDLSIVAVSHVSMMTARAAFPGSKLLVRSGIDGADRALLAAVRDEPRLTGRFDRLVIGSGDHMFTGLASTYRHAGLTVMVVGNVGRISNELLHAATTSRVMDPTFTRAA